MQRGLFVCRSVCLSVCLCIRDNTIILNEVFIVMFPVIVVVYVATSLLNNDK